MPDLEADEIEVIMIGDHPYIQAADFAELCQVSNKALVDVIAELIGCKPLASEHFNRIGDSFLCSLPGLQVLMFGFSKNFNGSNPALADKAFYNVINRMRRIMASTDLSRLVTLDHGVQRAVADMGVYVENDVMPS